MTKIQHVSPIPYARVSELPARAQQELQRNFEQVLAQVLPTGALIPWCGQSSLADVPQGWLFCDGRAVSRLAYSSLFAVIGTEFGAGDGSTTFNVPNMSDKFPRGTHLASEVGDTGGSAATTAIHTHDMGNHTHSLSSHGHGITVNGNNFNTGTVSADHGHHIPGHNTGEPSHGSVWTGGGHIHNGGGRQVSEAPSAGAFTIGHWHGFSANSNGISANHTHNANHGHSASSGGPTNNTSGGPSTNSTSNSGVGVTTGNLPPYIDFRFIIKT